MHTFTKAAVAALGLMMAGFSPALADHQGMKKMGDKMMAEGVHVSNAWARATAKSAKNGAAYMTLMTHGEADELVSVSGAVSAKIELHTHENDNGVMRMREVKAIAVEPGSPTVLQPGGLHIMLLGLKAPLAEGESFPLTLNFKSGKTKEVKISVSSPRGPKMDHGHHGHKH